VRTQGLNGRPRLLLAIGLGVLAAGASCAAGPSPRVPIEASSSTTLVAEARIICTGDQGTHGRLLTPTVEAHADGVHFVVVNPTDQQLIYDVDQVDGLVDGSLPTIDPGQTLHVLSALEPSPSLHEVNCGDSFSAGDPQSAPHIRVIDPRGFWKPYGDFSCPRGHTGWAGPVASPKHEPILKLLPHQVTGLRNGDDFRVGGYVHGRYRQGIVLRDGREIMDVGYVRDDLNRWRPHQASGCDFEGLGVRYQ
jgi:hypothetical protein